MLNLFVIPGNIFIVGLTWHPATQTIHSVDDPSTASTRLDRLPTSKYAKASKPISMLPLLLH